MNITLKKLKNIAQSAYHKIKFKPTSGCYIDRNSKECDPLTAIYISRTKDYEVGSIENLKNEIKKLLKTDDLYIEGFICGFDNWKFDEDYFQAIGKSNTYLSGFADGESLRKELL